VVVVLAGWAAASSRRTVVNVSDVLIVRIYPYPGRVAWFAAHGMPQGAAIDALAREQPPPARGMAPVVVPTTAGPTFAALHHWVATRGEQTYVLWLITHPGYVITEPLVRPERAFNSAQGNLAFYAPTTENVVSPLTTVLWPSVAWLGLVVLGGALLTIWRESWRLPTWRMAAVVAAVGGLTMVAAWHGDGQEVTRHTVEGFAQLRLGVWLLVVLGALSGSPESRQAIGSSVEGRGWANRGGRYERDRG
jgi:hypothetical protein